ncbi:MAG: methionine--tRNA ligase [Haloarculaceae archaeon]
MSHEEFPTDRPAVVTCGLPYANGDLHVGHLRGYVGADVLNRALRKLGQNTAYVCGSDMHGTPIAVNAAKEGVSPEAFAMGWHEQYEETFPKFDVDFDNYGHTHDETNVETTKDIVLTLEENGYVYEKAIMVGYDPEADQYLPDRFVEGTCPYCGERARGDECDEGCGRHLEPGEVEDPVSVVTGNPAEYRERTHKFFRVSELQEYLQGFIDRLEGTSNARNQPREWIEGELRDWCITRDMDWGIDYPGEGSDDLVLYVWVDAPIEYISSTKQYSERVGPDTYDWEEVWKEDGGSASGGSPDERSESGGEVIHVIGRDIIQHHTVFWPAMLHAAGYTEPRAVAATGFITIDGKGLSTSRNRAIWAEEYLEEGFHPDLLRFYLATNGGLQQDVDFSWAKFRERVNNELVGTLGNFLYRSTLFAERNYGGTPEDDVSEEVEERIEAAIEEFHDAVNDYSIREVGESAVRLARFGNEYIQHEEPWNLLDEEPDRARAVIRDCVQLAKAITTLFEPIAPGKAAELWAVFGGDDTPVRDVTIDAALEPPAAEFDEPTEPFEKVADERVEELNEKLAERIEAASDEGDAADDEESETESDDTGADASADVSEELEPVADERISFDEFQGLDIRVGRVESAEPIEGADELLKLEVDIGVETRQIVAGIRQLHDVDALPGTRIIVVANLEKAELFGVESNGMLLAAGEEADLLTTLGDAEPGERVR